jgi:hypothetical protein
MKLSRAQKMVRLFTSASRFEKIMEESKKYQFTCSCGKTSNIWEIGGVKYKATTGSLTGIRCPHCGKFRMQKIFKVD